jgi:hypothetical protein
LHLVFRNLHTVREATTFRRGEKTVALQQTDGFLPNYYRAVLILLCHIALLAALGLMAGSVLSFPVASLTVVFFFIVGLIGPWFITFLEPEWHVEYGPVEEVVKAVWRTALKGVMQVCPHFGQYNPLGSLTDGRLVSWPLVATAGAVMFYVKSAAALALGMYLYARRELARVIV